MENIFLLLLSFIALTYGNEHYKNAAPGEFPFQVCIKHERSRISGSIINEKWLVTAASALKNLIEKTPELKVVIGTVDLKEPQITNRVNRIIIHENYDRDTLSNDIALVEVLNPIKFSETVRPIALPEAHTDIKANSSATFSGWGAFKRDCDYQNCNKLEKAEFYIVDQNECFKKFEGSWNITSNFICATDPFMVPNECGWGDHGGPLTNDGKLIGIMSWPFKGCDYLFPYVYTRIPEYIDWINNNINKPE